MDIQEGICFGDLRRIFENFNEAVLLNNKDSVAAVIAMRQKSGWLKLRLGKAFTSITSLFSVEKSGREKSKVVRRMNEADLLVRIESSQGWN